MNREDVPAELIDEIGIKVGAPLPCMGFDETRQTYREILAAVLPAHREQIAREIEAYGKKLTDQAVDLMMKDDPDGFSAIFRAAAITSAAKIVRGEAS